MLGTDLRFGIKSKQDVKYDVEYKGLITAIQESPTQINIQILSYTGMKIFEPTAAGKSTQAYICPAYNGLPRHKITAPQ